MNATNSQMPWDEPSRLKFYGVDPEAYGNRERNARRAAAQSVEAEHSDVMPWDEPDRLAFYAAR